MSDERYVELSVADAMRAWHSRSCPACTGYKLSGNPFCRTDFMALPLFMRGFAQRGPDDSHFVEYYRRAMQHLKDFPTRRVQVLSRGGLWPYTTFDELDNAGYRLIEHTRCQARSCAVRISLYRAPNGHRIAINYDKPTPHSDTCKDPEYFARVRAARQEVRASAKRKRRA